MTLPYSSYFSEIRKIIRTGSSYGVTLPSEFVKALETIMDRNLVLFNLNNTYIIVTPLKMSHNDLYDLLQLTLTLLEVLYHNTDENQLIKQDLKKIYEKLLPLQEVYDY